MVSKKKALRQLSRREATPDDFTAWQNQVKAVKNDRGAALLLSANVEAALDRALSSFLFFSQPRIESLFAEDGPLATFHRKIAMGLALRIYGKETYFNLEVIRHVRNAFAHAHAPLDFKAKEISAICQDFVEQEVLSPRVVPQNKAKFAKLSARKKFQQVCDTIAHNLVWHSLVPIAKVDQNALRPEFTRRPDDEFFFRKKPLA